MSRIACFLFVAALLVGCGTMPNPKAESDIPGPQGIPGPAGPQGSTGPRGLQGVPGDSSVLSWASISGGAPDIGVDTFIGNSGGPIGILDVTRLSRGIYEIEYDVPTNLVGIVAVSVSGAVETEGSIDGDNIFTIHSAEQQLSRTNLTIRVSSVATFQNSYDFDLADTDALFYIVIYGDLP